MSKDMPSVQDVDSNVPLTHKTPIDEGAKIPITEEVVPRRNIEALDIVPDSSSEQKENEKEEGTLPVAKEIKADNGDNGDNCEVEPSIGVLKEVDLTERISVLPDIPLGIPLSSLKDPINPVKLIDIGPKDVIKDKQKEKKGTPPVYAEIRNALAEAQATGKFLITVSYPNPSKKSSFEHFFAVHNYPTDDIKGTMAHLTKDLTTKLKLDSTPKGDLLGIDHWK